MFLGCLWANAFEVVPPTVSRREGYWDRNGETVESRVSLRNPMQRYERFVETYNAVTCVQ